MLRNLTSKMKRRRILLLITVSVGILMWCLLRPSTGLPREVAAIGGRFENNNLDIPSGTRALKQNQLQTLILEDSRLSSESLGRIRQGLPKVDVRDSYMSAEESTESGLYEQIQLQGYIKRLLLISAILVVGYMVRVSYGIGHRLWFRRRRESAS
jgi:hypothetical protein